MIKIKKNLWTVLLLITVFWSAYEDLNTGIDWFQELSIYEENRAFILFQAAFSFILVIMNLVTFVLGVRNKHNFIKSFITTRILAFISTISIILYIILVGLSPLTYMLYSIIPNLYTVLSILYLMRSSNIKEVYSNPLTVE